MASSAVDPSGFVTNPPSTIVKIQGTARDDINGKLGIVVQYNEDRGRYLVHMTSTQSTVAMKPDNLIKASYIEQFQAQYEQLIKDENVRRMLATVTSKLQPGVTLKHVGTGVVVLLMALIYGLGISRTLMLISFAMMVLMIVGQDLVAGADMATVAKNAPQRFQTMVREQFPGGSYIADKPYAVAGLAAIMVVFFVKSMMPPAVAQAATAAAGSASNFMVGDGAGADGTSMAHRGLMTTRKMQEYYKMGFEDATTDKEFGASLPAELLPAGVSGDPMMDDLPHYPMPPPPNSTTSMLSKAFSLSNAMSIMYLGRTAMDLGKDADGSWQFGLFKQNLVTLEPMRMGFLGLSLFRIASGFLS